MRELSQKEVYLKKQKQKILKSQLFFLKKERLIKKIFFSLSTV
jgi:hypothetical protein